jgi:hypothetical protein
MKEYATNYDFKKDLPIAERTEEQMGKLLEEKLPKAKLIGTCNTNAYDLKFQYDDGKTFTVEVKEDFTCERTGNVGVEYESWGRRAGIAVSKADYYLYKVHRPDGKIGVYIIKKDDLIQMIKDKKHFRDVCGGDPGSNSWNHLFKLNVIKDNFMFLGCVDE